MNGSQAGKPSSVVLAVRLLWVSFAIGIVRTALEPTAMKTVPVRAIVSVVSAMMQACAAFLLFTASGKGWSQGKAAG